MNDEERVEIVISSDVAGPVLMVDGVAVELASGQDPELVGIGLVAAEAARRGRPVPAVVIGDGGSWRWRVLVHPDGTATDDTRSKVEERPAAGKARRARARLALAAIMVVVGIVGVAAVAVVSTAGQPRVAATGDVGAVPTPVAVPPVDRTPVGSSPPTATAGSGPPAAAPGTVAVAAPPAVTTRAVRPSPSRTSAKTPDRAAEAEQRKPVTPAPPPAAVGRGVVISDGAGLCVSAGRDGTAVRASACDSSAAQQWTATAAGELRHGARCLVSRSGVAVLDCATVDAAARTWTPTQPKPGLVNAGTGLCLVATGTKVVAAQCGTGRSLAIT